MVKQRPETKLAISFGFMINYIKILKLNFMNQWLTLNIICQIPTYQEETQFGR